MDRRKWWKEGVAYQIYPRSFKDTNGDGIGDLGGILEKMDYFTELGIDMVWLSPVYQSPNDDNGYDISNYYDIMEEYGTMKDMEDLIQGFHQRGIRVIMDLVVNHTSDEHPFFVEACKGKDNPYRNYYMWHPGRDGGPPTNWRSYFGGSTWAYHHETGEYYLHLFSRKQPDLNWENPQVRKEIQRIPRFWAEKGIDGFRLDAINLISKDLSFPQGKKIPGSPYGDGRPFFVNGPRIHEFLHQLNQEVFSQYDLVTVGETSEVTPEIGALYVNEKRQELDMIFHFQIMELDRDPAQKWKSRDWQLSSLKKILLDWDMALMEDGWNSIYFNNHDQPRSVSRFGEDGQYRKEAAKMLSTLTLTLRGTPFLYQGEELGMTNTAFESIEDYRDLETLNWYQERQKEGADPQQLLAAIHSQSRDNARTPMQWNNQFQAGFTTGVPWIRVHPNYPYINVAQNLQDEDSVFHHYRKMIQLRKENPVLIYGDFKPLLLEDEEVFLYLRILGGEKILVLLNFTPREVSLPRKGMELEGGTPLIISGEGEKGYLSPFEARVLRL